MRQKVLIVDDTPAAQQTIEGMLFKEGYELAFVDSGWDCFDYLEQEIPDLILLDVMMPGLSGYQVCQRLKQHDKYKAIPIILLTALNKKEDVLEGLEAGADEFVSKPVSAPEIRARVRNLLKMKKLRDELEQTLEFRQDLTRFLVHDMRNPLISIRLTSELGLMDGDEKSQEAFGKVLEEVQTLQSYVDQMLIAASLEGSNFQLHRTEFPAGDFVAEWLRQGTRWCKAQIDLSDKSAGALLWGDQELLKRVLDNLVSNAVKYGEGSPVELHLESTSEQLSLSVADQGPGIPDEDKVRVMQKLEIVPLRRGNLRQTGLGLYFCRLVAEAHGGTISVSDNSPCGSIFRLSIPLGARVSNRTEPDEGHFVQADSEILS